MQVHAYCSARSPSSPDRCRRDLARGAAAPDRGPSSTRDVPGIDPQELPTSALSKPIIAPWAALRKREFSAPFACRLPVSPLRKARPADGFEAAAYRNSRDVGQDATARWTTFGHTPRPAPQRRPDPLPEIRDRRDRHCHAARQQVGKFTDRYYTGRVLVVRL